MDREQSPIVASLQNRSPHPYSSIALSPSRQHAVAAAKDTLTVLSVRPSGLSEIRSLRVSQHLQAPVSSVESSIAAAGAARSRANRNMMDIRDTFGYPKQSQSPQNITNAIVTITDVVWSLPSAWDDPASDSNTEAEQSQHARWKTDQEVDSFVAAAGSNGVIAIWNARHAFLEQSSAATTTTTTMGCPPDAVLSHSSRAVNRLAWHPTGKYPGYLLTASQDGTVKLWARKLAAPRKQRDESQDLHGVRSWFGLHSTQQRNSSKQSYSWECSKTFSPKSEAIREVRWSPFHDDIFALVTDNGHLIVYNINHPEKPWERILAHGAEASTLDWHPTRPYVIATGGVSDRSVKIWDLERKDEMYKAQNSNTATSDYSHPSEHSAAIDISTEDVESSTARTSQFDVFQSGGFSASQSTGSMGASSRHMSLSTSLHGSRNRVAPIHTLSISAAVTRLAWRPPAFPFSREDADLASADPHDGMIAIASHPIRGRAGGNGLLSLWSHHRPYMPLSVCEGHEEGAVTDFVWLDTPRGVVESRTFAVQRKLSKRISSGDHTRPTNDQDAQRNESFGRVRASSSFGRTPTVMKRLHTDSDEGYLDLDSDGDYELGDARLAGNVWQHVLSVGRDGRCLVQSFARGERPIARVPPSCFAMADLSPFQRGYGSLQVFSVHQTVPSGLADDFLLTGLRRDTVTAEAPGFFRETPENDTEGEKLLDNVEFHVARVRHPATTPELVFNVVDQGDLDEDGNPISPQSSSISIAPEVVHLSRFADSYKLYPDDNCPTRVDLCLHNAAVAERLRCGPLARMWRMLASLLKGSGLDGLPDRDSPPLNAMQFALLPTIGSLLEERANAGDVQTCVVICEVLQVIEPGSGGGTTTTRVPKLELSLVREWYLSYIGILHQMCLFSRASFLIMNCNDSSIGELNRQSTSIDESCPHCGKPILGGANVGSTSFSPRRVCNSCRRRIGFCFLCQEPVTGLYIWCPGCGHGGHLDCALEWFGGVGGTPVREMCPTGCGHRCNLAQQLTAFPRTESSMFCQPVSDQ